LQRVAFQLKIRPDKIEEYEQAHRNVWPSLIEEMSSLGIAEYSIFRQGVQLFLYLRVVDWDQTLAELTASPINQRWQAEMEPLLEPHSGFQPGEGLTTMQEIFYMPGSQKQTQEKAV
jgi:L-rhamnose mutarotase